MGTSGGKHNMAETYKIIFWVMIGFAPSMLSIMGYMIRVERMMAKTKTDICWIKKELERGD